MIPNQKREVGAIGTEVGCQISLGGVGTYLDLDHESYGLQGSCAMVGNCDGKRSVIEGGRRAI